MLNKDLVGRKEFVEKNPEVNLPVNLDTDLNMENFPSLVQQPGILVCSPLKEIEGDLENSWVKITRKGLKASTSTDVYQ
jgi:hypothetical protein